MLSTRTWHRKMANNLESLTRDSYSAADGLNHDGGDPVILLPPSCWEYDTEYWKTVGGDVERAVLGRSGGLGAHRSQKRDKTGSGVRR